MAGQALTASSPPLSLARGCPSVDLLPIDALRRAAADALSSTYAADALLYGPAAGHPDLRQIVAARFGVTTDQVVLANSSLVATAMVCEVLDARHSWVACEAPTYDFALRVLARASPCVRAIDRQPGHLDTGTLRRLSAKYGPPACVYTIPTFHNPTGWTLDAAGRDELLSAAADIGTVVIEDDPYGLLRFEGASEQRLLRPDSDACVVHVTSFSKTLAPGLRAAVLVLPQRLAGRVERLAHETMIASGPLTQAIVAAFHRTADFDASLDGICHSLRRRRDALRVALECIPSTTWSNPAGGYFLWGTITGVDTNLLEPIARRHGVDIVAGSRFYDDGRGRDAVRVSYASLDEPALRHAAARLAAAVDESRAVRAHATVDA